MSSTTLAFDILARDRASRTFTTVGRSAETSSRGVRLLGSAMKYTALGVAGGVTAVAALSIKLGKAAADDQVAARNLALQMRNSADATRGQIGATEEWITAQGKALGVTDDELRPALAKLVAATDSVTKARRLTALAEDVAAGRGKSLATVTEALSKAQLGSLGGLARLGVRTKDAAGEALTLKEITQDLAKTYQGQAAKAADTAAGRYNRLKVMFSETGEAIGYKLLPPATELAGWLLDEGVPAAEHFAHTLEAELGQTIRDVGGWIKTDGIDLLRDFGDVLTDDVLPAAKTTGRVVGDAVGFFDELPGPVKSIGIEAGIAALIVPRLTGAVSTATGAVKTNIDSLRTWRTEMAAAETAGQRATAMLGKLGPAARTAAGIGGMVALTQATHETDTTMRTLTATAGGALMGFSVGGPWGAAIGGGVGLLASLATQTDGVSQSLRVMRDAADAGRGAQLELRDALNQTTGAMTKQAREDVAQDIYNQHLTESANRLGIANRDLVSAILGQEGAYERISRRVERYINVGGAAATTQQNLLSDAAVNIGAYLEGASAKYRKTRHEIRAVHDGTVSWSKALRSIPKEIRPKVRAIGADATARDIAKVVTQSDALQKHGSIRTVVKALGTDVTVRNVRAVLKSWDDLEQTRPDLSPALRQVTQFSLDAKREAVTGATSVGSSLKYGILDGFEGTAALLAAQAAAAVRQAIAAARREGDIRSPSRKMHKIGQQLGDGMAAGIHARRAQVSAEGANLIRELVHGIGSQERPLQTVVDRVSGYVDTWQSKLKGLQSQSRAFAGGFQGFATSVFSADLADPTSGAGPTVRDILGYAQDQRAQASQVRADVAKLQKAGISTSLLKQLQASGPSGLAQIHALAANATNGQIRQLGMLDRATSSDLRAAGTRAAGQVYGAQIRNAQQNVAAGRKVEDLLEKIEKHLRDGQGDIYIELEGRTIKTSQRDHDKKHRRG